MVTNNLKLSSKQIWRSLLIIVFAVSYLGNAKANAQSRGVDTFSVNSSAASKISGQNGSNTTAISRWFSKYDQIRAQYRPTEKDKVILTRPLMQQAERVQQWTNTASKVAKDNLQMAKLIKGLVVPPGMSDVKEYRDLMVDWFEDAASVYLDLIRPRPAAKTIEDLQEQLDAIKKRSEGLANNIANLKNMDHDLRKRYNIQSTMQDDNVPKFANSK